MRGGCRSSATRDFFIRKPKAPERPGNGRMMDPKPFGIGERIAQLKKRDVRILADEFQKKSATRPKLARTGRSPAFRRHEAFSPPHLA